MGEDSFNNNCVTPLYVLGHKCAILISSKIMYPWTRGLVNVVTLNYDRGRLLQLLIFNYSLVVKLVHQTIPVIFLPFIHTSCFTYHLNDLVKPRYCFRRACFRKGILVEEEGGNLKVGVCQVPFRIPFRY